MKHIVCAVVISMTFLAGAPVHAQDKAIDLRGAWRPETYVMKNGTIQRVTGLITFTEKDWSVLFFILTDNKPGRASAEGGTYTVRGDSLVFRHLYHFAGGLEQTGKPEDGNILKTRDTDAADAPAEPCAITLDRDILTIHFPSGNRMTFRRSSGF